jgi:mono/diheme cytochrome c family protein
MQTLNRYRALALAGLLALGCGASPAAEPAQRWLLDPSDPLPQHLSEVGVYREVASLTAYSDVVGYVPNHPLYSNGLEKQRHLYLPEGTTVEVAAANAWDFPIGAVLAKTFSFEGQPVETRLLFRTLEGWDYALYQWLPDGSDAEVTRGNWVEVPVVLGEGGLTHTLPSRLDCRTCHETHEAVAASPVIGVSDLQAGADLVDAEIFSEPPVMTPVQGRTDAETAALSYFVGNCITCHNDGASTNSAFSLYPDVAVANTVDQPTESETGEGIRVVAGDPEQSVLYITVVEAGTPGYRGPFKAMPPIGADIIDPDASAVLGDWIESL